MFNTTRKKWTSARHHCQLQPADRYHRSIDRDTCSDEALRFNQEDDSRRNRDVTICEGRGAGLYYPNSTPNYVHR